MDKPLLSNNTTNRPIGWFVAFSLLLHALLFWGAIHHQNNSPMPAPQQAAGGLHISLIPYRVQTPKSRPEQREAQSVARQTANPATHTVTETTTKQQTENRSVADATFRERIMVKLRQSFTAHFVYPLLARQRNWQGEVLLAFRLERDGRISEVRVARSSGYSLLDHAALSALDQVGGLGEMLPRTLTVELPVIYRLEG